MNKYDREHQKRLEAIQQRIDAIYSEAVKEAAALGVTIDMPKDAEKPFSFDDYPLTEKRVNELLKTLREQLQTAIVNGVRSSWTLANRKNDELCNVVFGDNVKKLTKEQYKRYYSTNGKALEAFIARKENGLKLSDRVWDYSKSFKREIEMGLDLGIRSGLDAPAMARELKQYLKHPDMLFRRVRDEHGNLQLSKAAADFHPGRGVYRSSYMNARRLAATETNIAYRTADHERWKKMDFVVGIEIHLSNNHNCKGIPKGMFHDICDDLKGRYPKDFKFTGWHPHCRCYATSILKTDDEVAEDTKKMLRGEDVTDESKNTVEDVPDNFKQWVKENEERIDRARKHETLPYFIRDNEDKEWFSASMSSRYDDAYLQTMAKRGIKFSDGLSEKMDGSPFNRLDVVRLNDTIQDIFAKQGVSDLKCVMKTSPDGGVHLSWKGEGVDIQRAFRVDGDGVKYVDHELFSLDRKMQGQGVSRKVFKALYEQYRVAGVERIELYANIDIGGYAWARYGFCVKSRNEAISAIRFSALTARQEKRIVDLIDGHFDASSSPFQMNKIASLPYGKKALLGSYWDGMLDLTDTQQRRVFERYLRR